MALNNLGIGFVFTARDLASAQMRGLQRSFHSLDRSSQLSGARIDTAFRTAAAGLAVFGAGAATLAGTFSLANAAGQFGQAIASVGAVARASAEEVEQLRQRAIQAGVDTQFSPTEAAQGLQELAQRGLDVTEAMTALDPALDLAAASLGQIGPSEAAGLVTQAMRTFGQSADQARGSVDEMVLTANSLGVSIGELTLGLGTASRGALGTNQSLRTTLVGLGLVRNIVPSVERASTALAVSMERLARPEVQAGLRQLGVSATEGEGQFRDFLDIVVDLTRETSAMSEVQRAAQIQQLFGQEASAGLLAIMQQLRTGVRGYGNQTLHGAEAVRFLRLEMEASTGAARTTEGQLINTEAGLRALRRSVEQNGAQIHTLNGEVLEGAEALGFMDAALQNVGGSAQAFSDRLLDTFAGQKTLLSGTFQTLAIVVGEPFAKVLKPVVSAVKDGLNGLIQLVTALPEPVKRAFAGFAIAAGAMLSLVGVAMVAKAAFVLLAAGMSALGITLSGLIATMLPAILILGVLSLVVAAFVVAVRRDVGGIGSFFRRAFERVKLFVVAMGQLFRDGAFSGAVLRELNHAENRGIKAFAVRVFLILVRIRNFFSSMIDSFGAAIEGAAPTFERLVAAFRRVGEALGFVTAPVDSSANAAAFDAYGEAGGAGGRDPRDRCGDLGGRLHRCARGDRRHH